MTKPTHNALNLDLTDEELAALIRLLRAAVIDRPYEHPDYRSWIVLLSKIEFP